MTFKTFAAFAGPGKTLRFMLSTASSALSSSEYDTKANPLCCWGRDGSGGIWRSTTSPKVAKTGSNRALLQYRNLGGSFRLGAHLHVMIGHSKGVKMVSEKAKDGEEKLGTTDCIVGEASDVDRFLWVDRAFD